MTVPVISTELDEAFERMAASSAFELPNGFVNHGPMGCEALAAMGLDEEIGRWVHRFERVPGPAVTPIPSPKFEWQESIGDYRLLPEWVGYFQLGIDGQGWRQVIATWVPRLSPGLSVKLFHGVIHVGHAVRALTIADTPARRAELARALGYWAARFHPGQPVDESDSTLAGDLRGEVIKAAEDAARRYVAAPSILYLHGITGAMALDLLIDHVSPEAGRAALAQLSAEHDALFDGIRPVEKVSVDAVSSLQLAHAAAQSGDVHQVKLVEACQRAIERGGSPAFAAAAEVVTGRTVSSSR
jgi:hypothetical protein